MRSIMDLDTSRQYDAGWRAPLEAEIVEDDFEAEVTGGMRLVGYAVLAFIFGFLGVIWALAAA